MFYLVVHLYRHELQEDLMLALEAQGISDVVIVDAVGKDKVLAFDMPIFAGFKADLEGRKLYAKLIMALVPDRETAEGFVSSLRESGINCSDPDVCKILLLPAEELGG